MQQTKGSTSRTSAVGYGCDKHARPFTYGWKRLARTSGMQQHTEHRSVRSCSKLSVMTRAVLERPPPASFARQRPAVKHCSDAHRQRALLQESLLESAPSQTNTEGRLTTVSLCLLLFPVQLVLLVITVFAICCLLQLSFYALISALYVYSWGLLIPTGFIQFCQHYAGSWNAVHPICTEGGEQIADLDLWQQASKQANNHFIVDAKMLYLFLSQRHAASARWSQIGSDTLLCSGRVGNSWRAWPSLGLHKLHWQGKNLILKHNHHHHQ